MFRQEIEIKGKHAFYMKQLVEENKIFERNIDVFMTAPLIGYINGNKEAVDKGNDYSEVVRKIGMQAILKEEQQIEMIYRLIMLLDETRNLSPEEQIERAFREDNTDKHEENMELFYSYVRGGITILYENILREGISKDDYFVNINHFLKDFYQTRKWSSSRIAEDELDYISK